MPPPCPDTIPAYYSTTLHIIGGISLPINLIGFWLVWFQSPGMFGYKYCLCYMQLAAFLTELHMTWGCPAYYFFPLVGGYNTGEFLGQFISAHLSFSLWVGVYSCELAGGLCCFVYRHNAAVQISQLAAFLTELYMSWICPGYYFFPLVGGYNTGEFFGKFIDSHKSMSIWVGIYSFELAGGLCCFVYRHNAAVQICQNYPQCLKWMAFDGFEAYDSSANPMIIVTGAGAFVFVFIIVWYCFSLGVHTMILLQRLRSHMSVQTYHMHRAALLSLSMQLALPGGLIIIPKNIILYITLTESLESQEIATNMMFLMGSHSMCQVTVMVMSNSVYRRVLKEKIWKFLRIDILTNQQYGSSVEPSERTNSFVRQAAAQTAIPVA
ncbi:Protein CBR-SRI-11 [Caenorhabditis briggsae]|uniref:Protein CBR-SRI-11 n=1 Tax=Caenorhabditis briggsae TaxID=6238 RepID=A8XM13_CAEBR|nr:Protein CBR-SRI-11 [Caenorhabditis briggsae]CAP33688.2 Protein CBR-SRI-11 [Caenorhabditis briggsae]